MKMNKIRIAKAIVNGKEYLILITLDPDCKKVCMTMAELDDDGMTEVIVADDGFVTSKDEVGYESYDEDYEGMWEK
jgi:ABC-type polar amino acid transport system ATPase subunit